MKITQTIAALGDIKVSLTFETHTLNAHSNFQSVPTLVIKKHLFDALIELFTEVKKNENRSNSDDVE